ncbi:hypothetical protein COV16_01820 [Candidatus Woesearchaeota archaeon CG10_big_fil_rev_8_21_14_0_10_34_8]|nr:MAG: hypothetical protein COV16_01820 [Candidatus Woesearchaeota archaeon CG10_big_fil_rev_8_21_14_0_10_34_8]
MTKTKTTPYRTFLAGSAVVSSLAMIYLAHDMNNDNGSLALAKRKPVSAEFPVEQAEFFELPFHPRQINVEDTVDEDCGFNNSVAHRMDENSLEICRITCFGYDFSADGSTVAFSSLAGQGRLKGVDQDIAPSDYGHLEMFLLNVNGDQPVFIYVTNEFTYPTGNGIDNRTPSLSSDGNRIAFNSSGRTVVADMQEKKAYVISDNGLLSPDISSDGNRVVFYSRDNNGEIYVADLDNKTITNVSNNDAHDEYGVISADGRYVAFKSYRNCESDGSSNNPDVYIADLEQGTVRNVLHAERCDEKDSHYVRAFSFSGNAFSFTYSLNHRDSQYVVDLDTGKRESTNLGEEGSREMTFLKAESSERFLAVTDYGKMYLCDRPSSEWWCDLR